MGRLYGFICEFLEETYVENPVMEDYVRINAVFPLQCLCAQVIARFDNVPDLKSLLPKQIFDFVILH